MSACRPTETRAVAVAAGDDFPHVDRHPIDSMLKLILLVPAAALLLLAGEGIYHAARGAATGRCRLRSVQPRTAALATRPRRRLRDQLRRRGLSRIRRTDRGAVPARPARRRTVGAGADRGRHARPGGDRAGAERPWRRPCPTSEQSLETMRKVVAQLQMSNVIDGLVRTGFIERLRSQRILSGLGPADCATTPSSSTSTARRTSCDPASPSSPARCSR